MAAEAERRGETIDPYVLAKAREQGFGGNPQTTSFAESRQTVPIRENVQLPGTLTDSQMSNANTVDVFVPYGNRAQTEIRDAKVIATQYGEVGVYQKAPGHSIWQLVSSGSPAALQSGKFTINKPETPVVFTQESGGSRFAASADYNAAMRVIANPEKFSRTGAEVYGGFVSPLDNRTVQSTGAKLSTYSNKNNLAGLVDPYAVNTPKGQREKVSVPWGNAVSDSTPAVSVIGKGGFATGKVGRPSGDQQGRQQNNNGGGAGGDLPAPFISGYKTTTRIQPKGELPFLGEVPYISPLIATGERALQDIGLTDKQYLETTNRPSPKIETRTDEITVAGMMAGGKSDFGYKLSTTFEGLDAKPWVASRGEIPVGSPVIGEKRAVGAPKTTTSIDPLTGDTITTIEQAYEQESSQNYQKYDISKQTYSFRPAIVSDEMRTEKGGITTFEDSIRSKLPSPEQGERAVQVAMLANPMLASQSVTSIVSERLGIGDTKTLQGIEPNRGAYTFAYEHPSAAGISYLSGGLFRGGMGVLSKGDAVARSGMAEQLISRGGSLRAVEQIESGAIRYAPGVLKWGYAGSVAYRATEGGTDFNPGSVMPRARGIAIVEMGPMSLGYERMDSTIKTVKLSNQAYIKAFGEGSTRGRTDFYLKQPVSNRVNLIKQDYASFIQEGTVVSNGPVMGRTRTVKVFDPVTGKVSGTTTVTKPGLEYATDNIRQSGAADNMGFGRTVTKPTKFDYIVDRAGFNKSPTPEPTTILETQYVKSGRRTDGWPSTVEPDVTLKAYGKPRTAWDTIDQATMRGNQVEIDSLGSKYTVRENDSFGAYKRPMMFDTATGKPIREVNILDRIGSTTLKGNQAEPFRKYYSEKNANTLSRKAYPEATQPMSIRVKSYLQEHPITPATRAVSPYKVFRPTSEITRYNDLAARNVLGTNPEIPAAGRIDVKLNGGAGVAGSPVTPKGSAFVPGGRVTGTRVVGGRTTPALNKEPSMLSQGIPDVAGKGTAKSIGSRTDFRNAPRTPEQSYSKSSAVLFEQQRPLSMIQPERVSQPPSFGFNILQVGLPGQRSGMSLGMDQVPGVLQQNQQRSMQDSFVVSRRASAGIQATAQQQSSIFTTGTKQGRIQSPALMTGLALSSSNTLAQASSSLSSSASASRSATRQTQRQTLRDTLVETTQTKTPKPPKIPGLWLPDGGGSSGDRTFSRQSFEGWSNQNLVGADLLGGGSPFSSGGSGRDNAKCRHKTMKAKMNCSRFWRNG